MRFFMCLLIPVLLSGCGKSPTWVQPLPAVPASDLVGVGDRLCFVGTDGVLYGLDGAGAQKWKFAGGKFSTKYPPVVAGKIVCALSARGSLVGLDPLDGQQRWAYTLGGAIGPGTAGDDYIVAQGSNALMLLKASTGRTVKRISLSGSNPTAAAPAGVSGFVVAARQGPPPDPEDPLAPHKAYVHGFLVPSLEEMWVQEVYDGSSLALSDDLAVFVQIRSHSNGSSSEAIAWNRKSGRKQWTWEPDTKKPALAARPALDGEHAFFTYSTGLDAFATDVHDKEKWRLQLPPNAAGSVICSAPVLTRELVLIGDEDQFIAVDRATGKKSWTLSEMEGKAAGLPLVLKDLAYLATDKKKLYAVKLR